MSKRKKPKKSKSRTTTAPPETPELTAAMMSLVQGLLSGKTHYTKVPITLEIPNHLLETYKEVARKWNIPLEKALENLANTGIQRSLSESMKLDLSGKDQTGFVDLAKKQGLDLSPLTDGLSKMSGLVEEITKLQKVFENESGVNTEGNTNPR